MIRGRFMNKISIKGLSHEEWLMLRKTGIGGSEAGAIAGVHPYVSAVSVFQDKISDDVSFEDNESREYSSYPVLFTKSFVILIISSASRSRIGKVTCPG